MANLSDAYGTLWVIADSKEAIEELKKVCKWHDYDGDYSTNFNEKIDDVKIAENKGSYEFEVGFTACGRWTYLSNVEAFLRWPYNDENNKIDFDLLKKSEFSLKFEFYDEEPGFEVLYGADAVLWHKANTEIKDTVYEVSNYEDYDRTWSNLIELGFYSLNDLMDCYLYNDEDVGVYETLKDEKDQLEKYFNKPLKEIIGNEYYTSYLNGEKEDDKE